MVISNNDVIIMMDKLKKITKEMAQIEKDISALSDKLNGLAVKYLCLENDLQKQMRKLRLKFIKETEKALDDEAKEYYGGE